jgi:hypothetical protein
VAANQWRAANGFIASGWLVALDRATGRVLWRTASGTGQQRRNVSNAPTVSGRLLLAADEYGNSFFAVDRFTGQEVWRVQGAADRFGASQSPLVVGGTGYLASNDLLVYAFEPETGRVLWRTPLRASADAFTVCGDRIFANHQGVAMLDRATGRLLDQQYGSEAEFLTSAFAVGPDPGRVYVVGNRYLYAFGCS